MDTELENFNLNEFNQMDSRMEIDEDKPKRTYVRINENVTNITEDNTTTTSGASTSVYTTALACCKETSVAKLVSYSSDILTDDDKENE